MVVDGGFVRRSSIALPFSCVGLIVRPPGAAFPTLGSRPDLPHVGDIVPKEGHVNLSKAVLLAQVVAPITVRPTGKAVQKDQSPGGPQGDSQASTARCRRSRQE